MRVRPLRIRHLETADLPVVRAWMRDDPGAPAWSDDDLAGIVRSRADDPRTIRAGKIRVGRIRTAWIAEIDPSTLAGFVVATALSVPEAPPECELELVLVPAPIRRRGIGRTLIHTVIAWTRDLGAEEIWLEVRASNMPALQLYRQCGFVIAGRRPGYYADPPEDAVLMRCRIGCERGGAPV
ncbi:MAG TPA: GNAT family N-acetyltransferase [Acidobacteriaceae bacterium]